MQKKLLIGVLAYNVENFIHDVINDLLDLNYPILIINDGSNDKTIEKLKLFENNKKIIILENQKNIGAGASLRKLFEYAYQNNYDFLVKVDGDGQFKISDVKNLIDKYLFNDFKFIKSNRFWQNGIEGEIPKKRFFGNLLATFLMQFTIGSNKLYDPLNGLFGVSVDIYNNLNVKYYPKRYGYPFFITLASVINGYKTYQINNTVIYSDQNSSLNSIKVFFTIIKLCIIFYFYKIKLKRFNGKFQRSAFLDSLFIFNFFISSVLFFSLVISIIYGRFNILTQATNLYLFTFWMLITFFSLFLSIKEENILRENQITNENLIS